MGICFCDSGNSNRGSITSERGGLGRKIEGMLKMEGHILWMIHADIWRKTAKFCKAIILQLNNKLKKQMNVYIMLYVL